MASTFNLVRNSRVFFTTNVDATTGVIPSSGATITPTNTFELQVLDGFSFTQGTQQATIQISEAGNTPTRGQRAFNTQLDPVDFSFSTYIRPELNGGLVRAEEQVLWNALFTDKSLDITPSAVLTTTALTRGSTTTNSATITCTAFNFTGAGMAVNDVVSLGGLPATVTNAIEWTGPVKLTAFAPNATAATSVSIDYLTAPSAAAGATCTTAPTTVKLARGAFVQQVSSATNPSFAQIHTGASNKNQLQKFGMYFVVDNQMYAVDNCALDQASIDFGLDGIATVAWTGKATALRQLTSTAVISTANPAVFSGGGNATGTASTKVTTAPYITNKLSTMKLEGQIQGGGTTYTVALTGGNITIANNINYVIPANLGVVNSAIGYFTGTRSISGNVTAYLRTGTGNSAQVLSDILTANASETKFKTQIEIGGASNSVHVDLLINGAVLQTPTVETGDVMSTTINFNAQGYDPILATNTYDIGQTNDLKITYYSV
jgi:hypothetical protein